MKIKNITLCLSMILSTGFCTTASAAYATTPRPTQVDRQTQTELNRKLLDACRHGNSREMQLAIAAGAKVNYPSFTIMGGYFNQEVEADNQTILVHLLSEGRIDLSVLSFLMQAGADPRLADSTGNNAFTLVGNHRDKVLMNILNGHSVLSPHFPEHTIVRVKGSKNQFILNGDLWQGAMHNDIQEMERAFEVGADINSQQFSLMGGWFNQDTVAANQTLLVHLLSQHTVNPIIISYLIGVGANPQLADSRGQNAFTLARTKQNAEELLAILNDARQTEETAAARRHAPIASDCGGYQAAADRDTVIAQPVAPQAAAAADANAFVADIDFESQIARAIELSLQETQKPDRRIQEQAAADQATRRMALEREDQQRRDDLQLAQAIEQNRHELEAQAAADQTEIETALEASRIAYLQQRMYECPICMENKQPSTKRILHLAGRDAAIAKVPHTICVTCLQELIDHPRPGEQVGVIACPLCRDAIPLERARTLAATAQPEDQDPEEQLFQEELERALRLSQQ